MTTENEQRSSIADRYIQFKLGEETYAIHLLDIKEVIPFPETTTLPGYPQYYIGIMNLRGQIISVIDLRKKLGLKKSEDEDCEDTVVIVELDGVGIGLVVDSITKVLKINEEDVSEIPDVNSQINARYIDGVYKEESSLTVLINLEKILDIKDIKKMQKEAA